MESQVGPYRIEREIGRGGMGVVYLAQDTRLDRPVAIKALPEALAANPDRLERFEREAKALAQLNHPNVAGIFGVEILPTQAGNESHYLILEYVEGHTLDERIDQGPIPPSEAVELATAIAAGVEAAHDAGIVHRDLKPANIKITPDGVAKVLDFGLARADAPATSSIDQPGLDSPTLTSPAALPGASPTMPGVILGTAGYMSPEQARGRRVDKRTDIWSFGVILYEMLTGSCPFVGETVSDSIGAILHKDLDPALLPPDTPPHVQAVIERCVQRDKAKRYRDIGDVSLDLQSPPFLTAHAAPSQHPPARSSRLPLALAAIAILLAAAAWIWAATRTPQVNPTPRRFDIATLDATAAATPPAIAIAPDASAVAYVEDNAIHVRQLSSFTTQRLEGTEGASTLVWSPDGKHIAFATTRNIRRVPATGGPVTTIATATLSFGDVAGGAWTDDDTLYFSNGDQGIIAIPARGGEARTRIPLPDSGTIDYHDVADAPEGVLIYIDHRQDGALVLMASNGTDTVTLLEDATVWQGSPQWSPTGHVFFTRGYNDRSLWALPFDPATLTVTSEPILVESDIVCYSVADDGTIAALRGKGPSSSEIAVVEDNAVVHRIATNLPVVITPIFAPDANALMYSGGTAGKLDIWTHNLPRNISSRVTFDNSMIFVVGWSPDGTELASIAVNLAEFDESKIRFHAANGSGITRPPMSGLKMFPRRTWDWVVGFSSPSAPSQVMTVRAAETPDTVIAEVDRQDTFASGFGGDLGPKGTLLAFSSGASGTAEVFCVGVPDTRSRWQLSVGGGTEPRWNADGSRIYYRDPRGTKIYSIEVTREPNIAFGPPVEAIDFADFDLVPAAGWDVAADGSRFLAIARDPDAEATRPLSIIENWQASLRNP